MTRDEWIQAFAADLGVEPPDADTIEVLLEMAGVAAHASERTAAPLACYLLGRAQADAAHGLATARAVAPEPGA
jgi:hypothetical protein